MEARDRIIRSVAEQLNISPDLVEHAARSQFDFLADVMLSASLKPVKLQYLGKFVAKPGRISFLSKQEKWVEKQEFYKQKYQERQKSVKKPPQA